jgi:hypothetical protein
MSQVTCFLCEGINHVPTEYKFYSTVQRMNQQAKDGMSQLLGKTPEDGRPKMKVENKNHGNNTQPYHQVWLFM